MLMLKAGRWESAWVRHTARPTSVRLPHARMATTRIIRMHVRPTATTAQIGFQAEYLSVPDPGSTAIIRAALLAGPDSVALCPAVLFSAAP